MTKLTAKLLILLKLTCLLATFTLSLPNVVFANSQCLDILGVKHAILKYLANDTRPIPADIVPEGTKAMVDLRQLLLSTPSSEFNALWSVFSKKDLYKLQELVAKNEVAVSKTQRQRLGALVEFVENDKSNLLWSRKDPYASLSTEYSFFRGPGYIQKIDGALDGVDLSSLYALRLEVIRGALKAANSRFQRPGLSKPGKWLAESFIHPYFYVKTIREFHDQVRDALGGTEASIEAIEKETLEESLVIGGFTPEALLRINEIKSEIRQLRNLWVQKIYKAYEQDVTNGGYQSVGLDGKTLDYHDIANNIKKHGLVENHSKGNFRVSVEKLLIEFENLLAQERQRTGSAPRSKAEMDTFERQVANFRLIREAEEELGEWKSIMRRMSSETLFVKYKYTITVMESQTAYVNGKLTTRMVPKQKTIHDSKTVQLTYEDILLDRLSSYYVNASKSYGTITGIEGKSRVLSETELAANFTKKYAQYVKLYYSIKELLKDHQSLVLKHKEDDGDSYTERLDLLKQTNEKLLEAIADLKLQIETNTEDTVLARWQGDNFKHFQSRTKELLDVLERLENWYSIYMTQLSLREIDPHHIVPKPDDSQLMKKLKTQMEINYTMKVTTPIFAGLSYLGFTETQTGQELLDMISPILEVIKPKEN